MAAATAGMKALSAIEFLRICGRLKVHSMQRMWLSTRSL